MEYLAGPQEASPGKTPPAPFTLADRVNRNGPLMVNDAVDLVMKVCKAVEFAHACGVIHRDLKPSNIVVTDELTAGGSSATGTSLLPTVKILDFGLARITDQDVQAATVVSEIGMIKGTLPYMSPEQARGEADAIDVRTDVYALGVILYEMLAGARPYDTQRSVLLEAVRVICEEPPRPLRQVWSGVRRLDADVETIAGKALEKEPARRYSSASALGEDVDRYLASQPILARPPSAAYQIRKLVARHRLPAAFVGSMLVLVVGFGIAMTVLYGRAETNRRRAVTAEHSARENFDLARGAVDRYLTRVAESPELRARGLEDLRRQLLETARDFYEKLAAQRSESEELSEELALAQSRLADTSRIVGDQSRAEEAYRQGIRTMEALVESEPANAGYRKTLAVLVSNLGLVLSETGRLEPAEAEFRRALDVEHGLLAADGTSVDLRSQHGNTLDNYGQMLERLGRIDDSERLLREAYDTRRGLAKDAPDDPYYRNTVVQSGANLSALYARAGRLKDARQVLLETLPIGKSLVAERPRDAEFRHALGALLSNLGGVEMLLEHYDASEEAYRGELETREALVLDHPSVLDYRLKLASTYTNLAELDTRTGKYDASLPWYDKSLETLGWILDREPKHATGRYFLSYTHAWKARALDALGRPREAVPEWDAAIRYDDRNDPELRKGRDRSAARAG
jgi:tetratricopeptide (TPR) repeat protein